MIRRSTLIVLVVLAALVTFSLYLKNRQASQAAARPTPTEGSAALFPATDGSPTDIKLQSAAGNTVEFARDQSGTWVVKAPLAVAADQAASEAAATQVSGLRVLSNVQLGLDVVGLVTPADTMTVTFGSGKTHKLLIGSVTPIQNGYYSQLDGGPVVVVDKPGTDALLGLLTAPPYLATLTPVASATATPEQATSTPAPSSTPVAANTLSATAITSTSTAQALTTTATP